MNSQEIRFNGLIEFRLSPTRCLSQLNYFIKLDLCPVLCAAVLSLSLDVVVCCQLVISSRY